MVRGSGCLLGFVLLIATGCAHPPAPRPAPVQPAHVEAAPVAKAAAKEGVEPAPAPPPAETTWLVNGVAARDDMFCWLLGDDRWQLAHWYARLNVFKEVDWAASRQSPAFGEIILVHHQLDPAVMDRIFAVEGAPLAPSPTPWRGWSLPKAAADRAMWSVDPHTIAFATQATMAKLASGEVLTELRELALANELPAQLLIRPVGAGPRAELGEIWYGLSPKDKGILLRVEVEAPALDPARFGAVVRAMFAQVTPKTPPPVVERAVERLTTTPLSAHRVLAQGVFTQREIRAAASIVQAWTQSSPPYFDPPAR